MHGTRILAIFLSAIAILSAQVPQASREQALGRVLSKEIEARERFVDDAQVNDYVATVAKKLAPACASGEVNVRVMQSDELNASTVPGGDVFITTALLRFVETESELAGVLAHLMKRAPVALSAPTTATPAPSTFITGPNGDQFLLTPSTTIPRTMEPTVQTAISAADERAMQCMDRAGYDPVGLIFLLQRMPAVPIERMERVAQTIMGLEPSNAFLLNTSRFFEVRRHLAAITPVQKAPTLLH
jgi:predicted Zn-dependent protease